MAEHKILAVITARGGSKGLPGKNVRLLCGKPLIAWTIEAAEAAKSLDHVIVSTDDTAIADTARRHGCDVPFVRPAEFATDGATQSDVLIHALRYFSERGQAYDIVMCLQPTSPLRTAQHIDEAIEAFLASRAASLISIKEQDYPPWWMFNLDHGRLTPAFDYKPGINVFDLQRQHFPTVYRPNGAIYLTRSDHLIRTGRLIDANDCAYYEMPDRFSISIDTEVHFVMAEALARLNVETVRQTAV